MVTKKDKKTKFLIGIDEAGRGALAGPVSVGAVMWRVADGAKIKKTLRYYPVGKDSKKLTAGQRDFWLAKIEELEKKGLINFAQAFSSNKAIDQKGINWAVKIGIGKCLASLSDTQTQSFSRLDIAQAQVLLDGGLKAPAEWINQQTIIRGDEKELIISLASIVAKVLRDDKMIDLGKKYPAYEFARHKGYGTKFHYQALSDFGQLIIHRQTYLKNLPK